jgi:hypothetical protein
MRIEPKSLDMGQTLHFEERVGGNVLVSVITWPDGKAEISVHDNGGFVQLFGRDLEDCIIRAEFLVDFFRKAHSRKVKENKMPWTFDNWRQELVKYLECYCTGMDDHDNGHLSEKGVPLLERCGKCRQMYSDLEPSIQAILHDARATGRTEVKAHGSPER